MKALFSQLAILLGGGVAVLSLVVNLYQRMDMLTAVFRSALVFFATVAVLFLFLRFFSALLIRFVAEQVIHQQGKEHPGDETPSPSGPQGNPVAPGSKRG